MFGLFTSFVKPKEPTPMELLIDKYQELIDSNGVSYHDIGYVDRSPMLNISINGTDIKGFIDADSVWSNGDYTDNRDNHYNLLYTGHIGVLFFTIEPGEDANPFFSKIVNTIQKATRKDKDERNEQEEKKAEIQRIQEAEKEQQETDKICMAEYEKLCGIKKTGEFNPQFKILGEIESLGKEQLGLIKTWEENNSKIESKRKDFYSLIQ